MLQEVPLNGLGLVPLFDSKLPGKAVRRPRPAANSGTQQSRQDCAGLPHDIRATSVLGSQRVLGTRRVGTRRRQSSTGILRAGPLRSAGRFPNAI